MCEVFVHTKTTELIFKTITCDRKHREEHIQCGCCSSCLLRRQALAANGIQDQTQYVVSDGRPVRPEDRKHLEAMLQQVGVLQALVASQNAWTSLSRKYPALAEIADWISDDANSNAEIIQRQLLGLYQRYILEWKLAQPFIEHTLLCEKERSDE